MSRLEILDGESWSGLVHAPLAVLVLARTTCPVCKAWLEELTAFLEADRRWQKVRFGRLYVDQGAEDEDDEDDEEDGIDALRRTFAAQLGSLPPSLASFERANRDWLGDVTDLPYNAIFAEGRKVKGWPGGGIDRLLSRLEKIEPAG
jgi:hypothetical protein